MANRCLRDIQCGPAGALRPHDTVLYYTVSVKIGVVTLWTSFPGLTVMGFGSLLAFKSFFLLCGLLSIRAQLLQSLLLSGCQQVFKFIIPLVH